MLERAPVLLLCLWTIFEFSYMVSVSSRINYLILSMFMGCVNLTVVIAVCFNDRKTLLITLLCLLMTSIFTLLHMIDVILTLIRIKGDHSAIEGLFF